MSSLVATRPCKVEYITRNVTGQVKIGLGEMVQHEAMVASDGMDNGLQSVHCARARGKGNAAGLGAQTGLLWFDIDRCVATDPFLHDNTSYHRHDQPPSHD